MFPAGRGMIGRPSGVAFSRLSETVAMLKKRRENPKWNLTIYDIVITLILFMSISKFFSGGYYIAIIPLRESAFGGNSAKSIQPDPFTSENQHFSGGKRFFDGWGSLEKQPFTTTATDSVELGGSCLADEDC
jgi:hypothetical protein